MSRKPPVHPEEVTPEQAAAVAAAIEVLGPAGRAAVLERAGLDEASWQRAEARVRRALVKEASSDPPASAEELDAKYPLAARYAKAYVEEKKRLKQA